MNRYGVFIYEYVDGGRMGVLPRTNEFGPCVLLEERIVLVVDLSPDSQSRDSQSLWVCCYPSNLGLVPANS